MRDSAASTEALPYKFTHTDFVCVYFSWVEGRPSIFVPVTHGNLLGMEDSLVEALNEGCAPTSS